MSRTPRPARLAAIAALSFASLPFAALPALSQVRQTGTVAGWRIFQGVNASGDHVCATLTTDASRDAVIGVRRVDEGRGTLIASSPAWHRAKDSVLSVSLLSGGATLWSDEAMADGRTVIVALPLGVMQNLRQAAAEHGSFSLVPADDGGASPITAAGAGFRDAVDRVDPCNGAPKYRASSSFIVY